MSLRPEMRDLGGRLVNIYMYRGSWRNIFIWKMENQTEVRAEPDDDSGRKEEEFKKLKAELELKSGWEHRNTFKIRKSQM